MAWSYEINPAKSLNGAGLWILNGPGTKSRFCASDHFESIYVTVPYIMNLTKLG